VSNETDDALLARYRAGDQQAFGHLVVRYQRPLYNAALWIVRNADDARDVTQEVFLKVAVRLGEYDPRYKFFSWIYRIAVNESLNLLRRNGRVEALDEEDELPAGESANPEWQFGEAQKSGRIRQALMSLSANDRIILMMRHFSELSYEESAGILELDEKTVKSRLYEARQRLRELLQDLRTNEMRKPSELTALMHAVLDGEGTGAEARALDRHLAAEPEARAEFDSLRALFDELKGMPQAFPPEGLVASVMADLPSSQLSARSRVISKATQAFPRNIIGGPISDTARRASRAVPFSGSERMNEQKSRARSERTVIWVGGAIAALR